MMGEEKMQRAPNTLEHKANAMENPMPLPTKTPVPVQLHRELIEADNAVKAVQQMMQLFQQQCQARLTEAHNRARAAWEKIREETGADMQSVSWEPHPSEPAIVPVQMRVNG